MSDEPLNPLLYKKLVRYYGDVEIVAPGEAIDWHLVHKTILGRDGNPKKVLKRKIVSQGEEYKVRCKLCRDHRARLHINHMWGVWDEQTQSRNLWAIQCFNEQCYHDYDRQKNLYDGLFALAGPTRQTIHAGKPPKTRVLANVEPPGVMHRLDLLAKKVPNHGALTYLADRGFNPVTLGRDWGVCYCSQSKYSLFTDRIAIPITMHGMTVGWQARYIGDDVGGQKFNEAGIPKYWTLPGTPRRLIAYNLDRALTHKTVVIVEGPADCWNVGPMAVGCIGKTMSPEVRLKLIEGMRKHGSEGVVVVALDPEWDPRDKKHNKPHHIERLAAELNGPLYGRVVKLYLPEGYDPGSTDVKWFRSLAREAASKRQLTLTFSRPTTHV